MVLNARAYGVCVRIHVCVLHLYLYSVYVTDVPNTVEPGYFMTFPVFWSGAVFASQSLPVRKEPCLEE